MKLDKQNLLIYAAIIMVLQAVAYITSRSYGIAFFISLIAVFIYDKCAILVRENFDAGFNRIRIDFSETMG